MSEESAVYTDGAQNEPLTRAHSLIHSLTSSLFSPFSAHSLSQSISSSGFIHSLTIFHTQSISHSLTSLSLSLSN